MASIPLVPEVRTRAGLTSLEFFLACFFYRHFFSFSFQLFLKALNRSNIGGLALIYGAAGLRLFFFLFHCPGS